MTPFTAVTNISLDAASLYRAEDALMQAAAQLGQVEERSGKPGLWKDEMEHLRALTNRVVSVRDGLMLAMVPLTRVQVGGLTISAEGLER